MPTADESSAADVDKSYKVCSRAQHALPKGPGSSSSTRRARPDPKRPTTAHLHGDPLPTRPRDPTSEQNPLG